MTANLRSRTNIICNSFSDAHDTHYVDPSEIAKRLSYWELLEYSRAFPILFPYSFHYSHPTAKQEGERDEFLRPFMTHLWPMNNRFKPLLADFGITPFFERPVLTRPTPERASIPADLTDIARSERMDVKVIDEPAHPRSLPDVDRKRGQQAVLEAPVHRSMLVLAPPGTGKTHILTHRLKRLIEASEGDSVAEAIVVLSFTRSAVTEISRRLNILVGAGAGDDLRYATVRTFDSYATWLLLKDLPSEAVSVLSYDERIKKLTQLLSHSALPQAAELIAKIRWLIVDEIQDLVGPRAAMVRLLSSLVSKSGQTVFLLGDPAQAIYDYQVDGTHELTSEQFLTEIRLLPRIDFLEIQLDEYRRFTNVRVEEFVRKARVAMGPDGTAPDGAELGGLLRHLGRPVTVHEIPNFITPGRSLAVLTRNNLQAYQLTRWCQNNGISAEQHTGASGTHWPAWIARLFFGFKNRMMSRDMAYQRWCRFVQEREHSSFEEALCFLEEQGSLQDGAIDIAKLRQRVSQRAPMCLRERVSPEALRVTTIHRSKGLEFDSVLLLEPERNSAGDPQEVRVLYVAATRARDELRVLRRDSNIFKAGYKNRNGLSLSHFHLYQHDTNRLLLQGMEDLAIYTALSWMSGNRLTDGAKPIQACQNLLWDQFQNRRGDLGVRRIDNEYILALDGASLGSSLLHICSVSDSLSADLRRFGQRYWRAMPGGLSQVEVAELATVCMWEDPRAEESLGFGCLALLPVVTGQAVIER